MRTRIQEVWSRCSRWTDPNGRHSVGHAKWPCSCGEVQLTEFAGLETARMQTWEIQRKCHLEQCVGFARKLIHEIDQANVRVNDDSRRGLFENVNSGPALDPFDL